VIGWYIHHVGRGHLQRAVAVSRALGHAVTGLSSLPRPPDWKGRWVDLPPDDVTNDDPTAGGQLHWAPVHDHGLRNRMATVSSWIQTCCPSLIVSDVSVEVALLGRLHGVPVISVVLPGDRSDPAHVLGYRVSHALVAAWPASARDVVCGLPEDVSVRVEHVGGLSRLEVATVCSPGAGRSRVTVLAGAGGTALTLAKLEAARRESSGWNWQVLAPPPLGTWVANPAPALREADVVVTHAGQNAVAEAAAARRPAVVIPECRPHDEQVATARALGTEAWPVTVLGSWPDHGWPRLLAETSARDGALWEAWCDGLAARRFAEVIERTADRAPHRQATA
jgi:hypothetical protein